MSNIKWSGIEQWKYGLTARWYVSAYYGNDTDVDAVGLYNPSTNPTGHGGPTRPFATIDKLNQESNVVASSIIVFDSGFYYSNIGLTKQLRFVGDGIVQFSGFSVTNGHQYYNATLISMSENQALTQLLKWDCILLFCTVCARGTTFKNNIFIDCIFQASGATPANSTNNIVVRGSGNHFPIPSQSSSNIFIGCSNLTLSIASERPIQTFFDYSIIIGTVRTSIPINGKTTGVTVEDFKADGNYFIKSYSEVDLFGNASGSGATVSQLNEIFNNFYYPYIDDYHNLDLTLRPDCDERVRFGGLNGTYIGALPVGYRLSAAELWNTHIDVANTSNLDYDMVNNAIVLASGQDVGTYTSLIIDLGAPITVDMVDFMANFVYNIEGTAKQGVSNQRIDTTPDLLPDNTENQRVVYDYRLQYSPDGVTALTGWKNLELNRMPTVDGNGLYQLEDGFNQATAQKLTIQRLKIEFTLRRIIIA